MDFLLLIIVACGLVWTTWFVMRGSLLAGCSALIAIATCFGFQFWHSEGGLAVSADRMFLVLLALLYGMRRIRGAADPKPMGRAEWVLFAFLGLLAFSTFSHDWHKLNALPVAHFVLYWMMPAAVYWIARQSPLDKRNVIGMFAALAILEVYLVATGLAEGTGQLWAVFPQYIASPQHQFFGRARGPFLNPSAMGIYLSVGLVAALLFWPRFGRRGQLLLLGFSALALGAIFATLTRSVWMGGALALTILMALTLPRQWTRAFVSVGVATTLVLVATNWDSFWNLKRDEKLDASAAAESAELRPILATIAWNMFQDRPLLGCGYGQYDPERLPYLADRSTTQPLEKTRPYAQHNAFLALLVETGLIGMSLFILLLVLWVRSAWVLWATSAAPLWARQTGLLMLATIGTYLPNAMFQDTNIIDGINLLLFFLAGVTSGLASQYSRRDIASDLIHRRRTATLEIAADSTDSTSPELVHI
jgi:O-antigen ligase